MRPLSESPKKKRAKRSLGSIVKRSDGRYQVSLMRDDGKRITRYVSAKTPNPKKAAEELLAKLVVEEKSNYAEPGKMTLSQWLREHLGRTAKGRSARTAMNREYLARAIFEDRIGDVPLGQLTPKMCQRWADELVLSHGTRSKRLSLLKSCLDEAVVLQHIAQNPARPVKIEKQLRRTSVARAWTLEEAQAFLSANTMSKLYFLWKLALLTGARMGELRALQVSDYDAEKRVLKITRTAKRAGAPGPPKTPAATRSIPLGAEAVDCITAQIERREEARKHAKEYWTEEDWLFPSAIGTLFGERNAHHDWTVCLKRADVPRIRMHDLRVTFISLALSRGAKPEVVAQIVGHASPSITLDVYRQVYEAELDDARDILGGLF